MKEEMELAAEERTVTGKKVKRLRSAGIVPAVIYGHDVKSVSVQVKRDELAQLLRGGARTAIFRLKLGRHRPFSVTIKQLQIHPMSGDLLHADFYRVAAKERIKMRVPIHFSGEAPVMRTHEATLIRAMTEIDVECLPADLPAHVVADLSHLEELGDAIHVSDLEPIEHVTFLARAEDMVISAVPVAKEAEIEEKVEVPEGVPATGEGEEEAAEGPSGEPSSGGEQRSEAA